MDSNATGQGNEAKTFERFPGADICVDITDLTFDTFYT
jgi:hypothetical protein